MRKRSAPAPVMDSVIVFSSLASAGLLACAYVMMRDDHGFAWMYPAGLAVLCAILAMGRLALP